MITTERNRWSTDDVALVELVLEVGDDVGARGHVGRDEDVRPVVGPSGVVLVVVGRRRNSLHPLRILLSLFPHCSSSAFAFFLSQQLLLHHSHFYFY
jgi:hypothetical protein